MLMNMQEDTKDNLYHKVSTKVSDYEQERVSTVNLSHNAKSHQQDTSLNMKSNGSS